MKASAFIFRFRMAINAAIVILGFWAPWIGLWGIGGHTLLLEWLALELARLGLLSFGVATPTVIVAGSLVAALGAFLRIWASAWLGHGVVINAQMQSVSLMADGPYRYMRNPLYVGLFLVFAALALLMPVSGALFALVASFALQLVLIYGEEMFLSEKFGEPYSVYLRSVPRLFLRLRTTLAPSGSMPRWLPAVLSELTPIGVFITIAFLSWTYDVRLMGRAVLISFGLSLVVRALMPGIKPASEQPR